MDTDTDNHNFISWPLFEEPSIMQTSFNLPYFDESNFMDFAPSKFNDSYDLLPLPESLEQNPFPLSCLPTFLENSYNSEAIMRYCCTEAIPIRTVAMKEQGLIEKEIVVKSLTRGSKKCAGKRVLRSCELDLEEIRAYFHMPITKAAIEMNVGLTVLKKRCRDLGVTRWPHRKLKSLNTLITNIQEIAGKCSSDMNIKELKSLEEHKKLMEENPEIQLTEETKKLRQACFKANYKRRIATQSPYLLPVQKISF